MSKQSVSKEVERRIGKSRSRRLWTFKDFADLPTMPVALALSRLVADGSLERLRRGVYYVKKESRYGLIKPSAFQVSKALLKKHNARWHITGLAAYNRLGLTSQVPAKLHIATRQPTNKETVFRKRTVSNRTWQERAILDALRDIQRIPGTTQDEVFWRIGDLIRNKVVSFERLVKLAVKEPPRVRALLGLLGANLKKKPSLLNGIRATLNPTTTFKLGLSHIPGANKWQIR